MGLGIRAMSSEIDKYFERARQTRRRLLKMAREYLRAADLGRHKIGEIARAVRVGL
jgi:hypothetical protein